MTIWGAKNNPEFFAGKGGTFRPVYGMRNWKIDPLGRLVGVMYKVTWRPGVNHAVCMKGVASSDLQNKAQIEGTAPDHDMDDCEHGFYAYYDGSRDYHERGDVTGIIKGMKEAVVGDKGFRCMEAEIVAIKFAGSVPKNTRDRVSMLYPEVAQFESLKMMLSEYPTSVDGLEYRPEIDAGFWDRY